MKKFIIALTLLGNLFLFNGFVHAEALDQMVATVNDDLITRSELNREIKAAKMQITQRADTSALSEKTLEKQVLEQLINKKIQLQLAEQAGIIISNEDVENAIQNIASQNNVTANELYARVSQEGLSPENYRREIHDQIVMQKLQQHEVAGRITITPEEVTAFMKSSNFQENGISEYRLEDILIPTSDTPSPQELTAAKTRATNIMQKLETGAALSSVTETDSKAPALQSNDLGWRKLAEIPSAFTDHVANMKKSSLAGPIQTPNGFHILKMTDLRKVNSSNKALPDRKAVEAMLMQQKFEQALQTWMAKLRSTAFISTTV